jgi:hypothetical protein
MQEFLLTLTMNHAMIVHVRVTQQLSTRASLFICRRNLPCIYFLASFFKELGKKIQQKNVTFLIEKITHVIKAPNSS